MRRFRGGHISYLLPTPEKEFIWINAVRDGATDDRKPVEDDGRLVRPREEELPEHVGQHDEHDQGRDQRDDQECQVAGREPVDDGAESGGQEPHRAFASRR